MKFKNNKGIPVNFHYKTKDGLRKVVILPVHESIDLTDYESAITTHDLENKWIEVINETSTIDKKMQEAEKDVEKYIASSKKSKKSKE